MLILLLLSFTGQVSASELVGPKAFGMGGAFTAVADDVSSLYWNPAGLTRSGFIGGEVALGVSSNSIQDILKIVQSLNEADVLDLVNNLEEIDQFDGRFTSFIGANLKSFSGSIILNEELRFDPEKMYSYRYSEKIGNIGLGIDLIKPVMNLGSVALGANFKIIQRDEYKYEFVGGEFVLINESQKPLSSQELGLDLGALVRVTDMVNLSLVSRNIKITLKEDNETSVNLKAPESITVGAAVKVPFPLALTVAADLEHYFATEDPVGNKIDSFDILHVGLEKNLFLKALSLRAGVYGPFQTTEKAFKDQITYTAGLGLNILSLHADLAVGASDDFEDIHTTLSASVKF